MPPGSEVNVGRIVPPSDLDVARLRRNLVRILFVHRSTAHVDRCLRELKRMRFTVVSEVVSTSEECIERLRSNCFDVIVAEYLTLSSQEIQPLKLLHHAENELPLVFLADHLNRETVADLILRGAAECIEMTSLGHLPVAIHRALSEKLLRDQRERAERDLRRSEARYRALVGNLNYGIGRCSIDGRFLEVNETMSRMLGYGSKEEVLPLDLVSEIIRVPGKLNRLLGLITPDGLVDPIEIEWRRKDQGILKVRLSGREVLSEQGELEAYEIIADDVTRQRELEEHLRRQAASDPLTGLANYRHFVEVLDSEIRRSVRTSRKFALLFFDLDGLKQINDRYGHMVGSQALCRLADVLCSCCRDMDTPARFGGDEFALVLPETNARTANLVARRICENTAGDGKCPKLSVSMGMAVYPKHGCTIESLLCAADADLYIMKRQKAKQGNSELTAKPNIAPRLITRQMSRLGAGVNEC
jgi:diguanylate cyclase (GGDEF)-like protein/PAS domain S-box-containing protein